jgi:NADH dehydrogenase
MHPIVVTGALGFVGQKLLPILEAQGEAIIAIARRPKPAHVSEAVTWIQADLRQPSAYEHAIKDARCVLHLAAATGKVRPIEYRRNNVEATRALLHTCETHRAAHFVFVSSIAAGFRDRRYYPYADSKLAAEALVGASPLRTTIVRPTMILGAGSPIQASLEKLARLPWIPLFGDGQRRVQPISVTDLVEHLAALARDELPNRGPERQALLEWGGTEVLTSRQLLVNLRVQQGGSARARFLRLPLQLTRTLLAWLERPLFPLLPLTAGQLATFANDGIVTPEEAPEPTRASA